MESNRWQRITKIFNAALAHEPAERAGFLDAACSGDPLLQSEIESLLVALMDAPHLLEDGVPAALARVRATSLTAGSRLGPYEILAHLGSGGMGEVFKALDTRLQRHVAVKALPTEVAYDRDRLARFEREAKLLAALAHPNVAAIFGLEELEGHRYLILEYVEGNDLAHLLDRGPLSVDDALQAGRQIAAALECAHEKGIAHRDLKPANIMLTPAGNVKVLDFGIAKGGMGPGSDSDSTLPHAPTFQHPPTNAGVILGTAAYMSPEQARGGMVDKRTDIWSFGCVLYECLTARPAFAGNTVSDLIAQILEREPDWNALPSPTPRSVRNLLHRCLEKDVRRRLRDIGDARIEIDDVIASKSSSSFRALPTPTRAPRIAKRHLLVAAVIVVAAVAATRVMMSMIERIPVAPVVRLEIPGEPGVKLFPDDGTTTSISPDGRTLVYSGVGPAAIPRLWIRPLESVTARELPGTDGSQMPFWSPDGEMIGFFAEGKLKRMVMGGEMPEVVCDVTSPRGGTWNADGVILFAPFANGPIYRVSAYGGETVPVTVVDPGEIGHRYPYFLPDGEHFLYSSLPPHEGKYSICMGSLNSDERTVVLDDAGSGVAYAEPGYLVYQRHDAIVAQRFDAKRRRVRGQPVLLGDQLLGTRFSGGTPLTVSKNGVMAYRGKMPYRTRLFWSDLGGEIIHAVPMAPGPYTAVSLSPDAHRAILESSETLGLSDLWLADLDRGVVTRFTYEDGESESPQWSPDGTRVAYLFCRRDPQRIVIAPVGNSASEVLLEDDLVFKALYGWTPDGRSIVYGRQEDDTKWDIWIHPLDGDRTPYPYLVTPFNEYDAEVSPDGRWILYVSDESGSLELYVRSFPVAGPKYQVTMHGALHGDIGGEWSSDGGQILWGNATEQSIVIWASDILPGSGFRIGPDPYVYARLPQDLVYFQLPCPEEKLLLLIADEPRPPLTTTVVLNWRSLLSNPATSMRAGS